MGKKIVRIALIPVMLSLCYSQVSIGGWFSYDTYSECVREERLKRMDRWFNKMGRRDASVAARDYCDSNFKKKGQKIEIKTYHKPSRWTKVLRTISLRSENQTLRRENGPEDIFLEILCHNPLIPKKTPGLSQHLSPIARP